MRKQLLLTCIVFLSVLTTAGTLEQDFQQPPRQAGIRCWWWWLNSNVTKDAITKDLQAMHEKHFSGALIFDAGGADQRGNSRVPAGPTFASPEWVELLKHAANEAQRLDIELGLCIQSGWNLGGPTVTPEMAAKRLTWSEIEIKGPMSCSKILPDPPTREGFYRDVAVLAFPIKDDSAAAGYKIMAGSSQSQFPPQNAIDEKPDTIWVSGGTRAGQGPTPEKPEWLVITFNEPTEVAGLKITGRHQYGPRKGCLEEWTDADMYQTVLEFEIEDGQEYQASFEPVTGKQFRLVFTASYDPVEPASPRNVQVSEMALLNTSGKSLLLEQHEKQPIQDLNLKASFQEIGWAAPDARFLLEHVPVIKGEEDTTVEQIVNLTDKLGSGGRLTWEVPAGQWCVMRFGYTCNNTHVSTNSDGWNGLVVDYLSRDSITRYLNDVVEPLLQAVGPAAGNTLKYLQTDSWECGGMNWTPKFVAEFKQRRGYDPLPYLPIIAGKIVKDRATSNRFLADFRKTISDCIAENHYQTFADFAHRHNMGIQPESGGPHAGPFDAMKNLGRNDIAMAEFWSPSPHRRTPRERFFVKQAASVAHLYGKKLVGAESFTTIGPHWNDVLWSQTRPSFNHEFCSGLNIVYLHTFTCSPAAMGRPGQEYFAGTHFNPQVTWWEYADGIIDYMMRNQLIAQQGRYRADVLYYYGDHVPNVAPFKEEDPAQVLPAYDYDYMNEEILLQLKLRNGRIVVPGGLEYSLLVLPDHKVLSLAALEKVNELLNAGAAVLGPKPERLVSLVGGDAAQTRFHELADAIWGDEPQEEGHRKIGTGTIFWGQTGRQVLETMNIAPDLETDGEQLGTFDYIHYTIDDKDVYFVCNLTDGTEQTVCRFRVTGKTPELWNPLTGRIQKTIQFTQEDGRTAIPVRFDPFGAWVVVFDNTAPKKGTSNTVNYKDYAPVQTLAGPWQVSFDPQWGGPESTMFETLTDWSENANRGIKFYSGKATYKTAFNMDAVQPGKEYRLDLGDVQDVGICRVVLNGKDLGIVWTKPFQVDITGVLKSGQNQLQVSVINSWRNRLIGDRNLPASQRYTNTNIAIQNDWQLEQSGLLGPVQVLIE